MSNTETIELCKTSVDEAEIDSVNYKTHLNCLPSKTYLIDDGEYSVKLLQSSSAWSIYETIWDALVKQSANHNLFQSYGFLRNWWHHLSQDNELYILFVCKDNEIIGFAAFNILKRKIRGMTFNEIGFIGSPSIADRPSMIMVKDEYAGIKAVINFLSDNRQSWDLVQIFEQEKGTSLDIMKQAFKDNGFWLGARESSLCYYLNCEEPWDEFFTSKSRKFRKNIRAAKRKLEKQGDLQYRVYTKKSDIEEQLNNYRDIEKRSHKEADGIGIASSPEVFSFYHALAKSFSVDESFCMRVITLDDKPIVATFGIYFNKTFYSLQIVHDKKYNTASPGTYLESLELEECYGEEDCELYDFLGSFVSNKSRWSSTMRKTEALHVYQRSSILTFIYIWHFIVEPPIQAFIFRVYNLYSKVKIRLKKKK